MEGLGATQHGRKGLEGDPHDVVLRLLGREGASGRLGMKTEHQRLWGFCAESFFHDPGPQSPSCSELGNLFKKIQVGIKEKRKPRGKVIHLQARLEGRLHVGNPIGQGKSHLLDRRRACLPDMVSADADGVP